LELLRDAITREGAVPPVSEHIPALTLCVTRLDAVVFERCATI